MFIGQGTSFGAKLVLLLLLSKSVLVVLKGKLVETKMTFVFLT